MTGRPKYWIAALLIVLPLALAACDDTRTRVTYGGVLDTSPGFILGNALISPQFLGLQPIVGFNCPFVQPFATQFDLIIDARSALDLFLFQVDFSIFDRSGLRGSPLLVSSSDIAARFNDPFIRAGTTRAFGFRPQFGCGLGRPSRIVATVLIRDRTGRSREMSVSAPIQ